jgi:hypothetical protein
VSLAGSPGAQGRLEIPYRKAAAEGGVSGHTARFPAHTIHQVGFTELRQFAYFILYNTP